MYDLLLVSAYIYPSNHPSVFSMDVPGWLPQPLAVKHGRLDVHGSWRDISVLAACQWSLSPASLPPTINSAETPGPASWWNHSTPLAAWKPFKASCTPSSFSPDNNGDFTGNNDLTNKIAQWHLHHLGFQLVKNEHNWGPAWCGFKH